MDLIERTEFLSLLHQKFESVAEGEGHCVFVNGEAGIGKTSLVKIFCNEVKGDCKLYKGSCDSLFTPRPLAPLYDIMWQVNNNLTPGSHSIEERSVLFVNFFRELSREKEQTIIVFEDIHWADEATLDFIKFFARRIAELHCLFIVTCRDNEIEPLHPVRNMLGQLPPDSFTRIQLTPLSREAVEKMAQEKGYKGEDVYSVSGGNPFYVTEILSSYSLGVPESIKDAILSAYNRTGDKAREIWDLLSVIPSRLETKYLEKFQPLFNTAIESCLNHHILIISDGEIYFKHELFRRTIESLLSPLRRVELNKKILNILKESFEQNGELERIVHHAKNANDYETVVRYAPVAAKNAATVGAHAEAARLFYSAIEYYQGNDMDTLICFYEAYAYECYLTNQIKEAIIYTGKSLSLLKKKNDTEKMGNSMRFLSRLMWFEGNRKQAESYAMLAIEVLEKQPSSKAKAMAYSNMSQLKMLSEETAECIAWGEKAIEMAKEIADDETLSHALNNVGTVLIDIQLSQQKGVQLLEESLANALKHSFHEHAARAYTNLFYSGLYIKDYGLAAKYAEAGIAYCEERDMNSWTTYMLAGNARMKLEKGDWDNALHIADNLIKNVSQSPVVKIPALIVAATVKLRRGEEGVFSLLIEAKEKAFETLELPRIIPALAALLEYEWITGKLCIEKNELDYALDMIKKMGDIYGNSNLAFWLWKARKQKTVLKEVYEGYNISNATAITKAATLWNKSGCAYDEALVLFEGTEEQKRNAITIADGLGATAAAKKMKMEMRAAGIKSIPRGIRKSTRSNTALLTERELDVLALLKENLQNKEIASRLFISAKTVDNHITSILFKLDVNSRTKAAVEALRLGIIK
jgi:DNA-binding CsgD family transcriptional regulator